LVELELVLPNGALVHIDLASISILSWKQGLLRALGGLIRIVITSLIGTFEFCIVLE